MLHPFFGLDPGSVWLNPLFETPIITAILIGSVQGFFIFRCWRIFQQRLLYTIPLLVLWVTSTLSGTIQGIYMATIGVGYQFQITCTIWVCGSLMLDIIMTTTTVVYLYRSRTGLSEHDGVFSTVWQVMWASAAPPLLSMSVPFVDTYIVRDPANLSTFYLLCSSGKLFALSLMITLVGRGYIRKQLEQRPPQPPSFTTRYTSGDSATHGLEAGSSLKGSVSAQESSLGEQSYHIHLSSMDSKLEKPDAVSEQSTILVLAPAPV